MSLRQYEKFTYKWKLFLETAIFERILSISFSHSFSHTHIERLFSCFRMCNLCYNVDVSSVWVPFNRGQVKVFCKWIHSSIFFAPLFTIFIFRIFILSPKLQKVFLFEHFKDQYSYSSIAQVIRKLRCKI